MFNFGLANEKQRKNWLAETIRLIPRGSRILDAGAGELANKPLCTHLDYVSMDTCQYEGTGDQAGLHTGTWNTGRIDLVGDITAVPQPDESFDAILCSEVFEHLPDPLPALEEFARLTKSGGLLILTAPFCSLTHFAPYHFSSGFNRYWYEHHLPANGFEVIEIVPNGNWFEYIAQELHRLPSVAAKYSSGIGGKIAYALAIPLLMLLWILGGSRRDRGSNELLTFGWHVVARRQRSERATHDPQA